MASKWYIVAKQQHCNTPNRKAVSLASDFADSHTALGYAHLESDRYTAAAVVGAKRAAAY